MNSSLKIAASEFIVRFAWVFGMTLFFVLAAWFIIGTGGS